MYVHVVRVTKRKDLNLRQHLYFDLNLGPFNTQQLTEESKNYNKQDLFFNKVDDSQSVDIQGG